MPFHPKSAAVALATPARWLMQLLAWLFLGIGVLGIFLPLLPTVPFILLSAALAARSSPRLSAWLERHPTFGPFIRDWREGGVVQRRSKWMATTAMAASAVLILLTAPKLWAASGAIGCMAAVLVWLWRRPERKPVPQ